ncbi:unnamed protein product [Lactuca saligna]|uniref:Uncharacterized protein n=1 Tax=Lactuca saligna TaxID=75948 RepID=A0AA36A4Y3_LACSI|nr:unnamed protein product [Lactuca saligna]
MVEFLATVSFRRKIGALKNINFTFYLGGERQELSLAELMMRTKIYLPAEVHTDSYLEFITGSIRTTEVFKDDTYWLTFANGTYNKGITQESEIWLLLHRLLHMLITDTINQRWSNLILLSQSQMVVLWLQDLIREESSQLDVVLLCEHPSGWVLVHFTS